MIRRRKAVNYARRPQHSTYLGYPRRWLRNAVATLLAVVLFVSTSGALLYHELNTSTTSVDITNLLGQGEAKTPTSSYDGQPINILVIGSDTRTGEGNKLDGNLDLVARSDTTILMHISADRTRVQMVSIPRDTIVDIPVCELSDGHRVGPQRGMFNWAFSVAPVTDVESSIACTWKTVEEFSDINIDEFVMADFNGFKTMVDALGGVNMYFEEPMVVPQAHLDLEAGCQHLDGAAALGYARAREGVGDGSDLSRIKRQQYLLSLMARTALNKSLLTDLPSLYQFLREGLKSLTVSHGIADVTTMAAIGYSLRDIDPKNIEFITAPVVDDPIDPNRVLFAPDADKLWRAIDMDRPLPGGLWVTNGVGEEYMTTDDTTPSPSQSAPGETESETPTPADSKRPDTPQKSPEEDDPFAEERAQCEPQ